MSDKLILKTDCQTQPRTQRADPSFLKPLSFPHKNTEHELDTTYAYGAPPQNREEAAVVLPGPPASVGPPPFG